jgi:hypothetical protein
MEFVDNLPNFGGASDAALLVGCGQFGNLNDLSGCWSINLIALTGDP